jgi:Amt family ammonium transporter
VINAFVYCINTFLLIVLEMPLIGLRVSEEEVNGLDMAELGMEAYPEFTNG